MENPKGRAGSITGRILAEGIPASGIEVALLPREHYYEIEEAIATTRTDEAGRYGFAEVPSGHYWLKVRAPGYVNAIDWSEEGPGRNASVGDGQSVENADLDLILGGIITGRITDSEGNPVVDEYVELTIVGKFGPPDETRYLPDEGYSFCTDSDGAYQIYGIPPGRYLISTGVDVAKVTGATRDNYGFSQSTGQIYDDHYFEQNFHPGVTDRARAKAIDISAGSEVRGVNIRVGRSFRAYAVSGRVINAEGREPIRQCYIQIGHYVGGGYSSRYIADESSDTDQVGNFRVEGLIPGRFFVSAQFEGETEFYCTPVEFEVKYSDINGLEIKAQRGLTLDGSVTIEGVKKEEVTTKLAQLKLRTESGHDSREAAVNTDGTFMIRGLQPGRVQVALDYEEASRYFSMVRIEYPDENGEIRTIPAPAFPWETPSLPIGERGLKGVLIVLLYKSGSIRGHVSMTGAKLASGTRLSAGISGHTSNTSWSTSAEVDANGNFAIDGLEPGEYQVWVGDRMNSFSQAKTIIVEEDSETSVSFVIDASARREEQ